MSELVAISKAARALGINRTDLSRRLGNAGITTFEGMVELADLRRVAPTFGLEEAEILERTRLIRENARAFRHDPGNPPPVDDLAWQIRSLKVDLLMEKQKLDSCQRVITALFHRLEGFLASDDPARHRIALELNEWLAGQLKSRQA
ncbi:MAG: hypothetical protein HQL33_03425 [Alphaproteobacteria bacterium]|nr:hypothetical protein [Alphaproteobacteria bacterium]MBF0129022.1 hypothetical protein [Alphaproteobacteria bacterium]